MPAVPPVTSATLLSSFTTAPIDGACIEPAGPSLASRCQRGLEGLTPLQPSHDHAKVIHMAERFLLDGADLINGTGGPAINDSMVLIEDGRIVYAGPRSACFDDDAAVRVGLAGKTLIPGLIEAHTHACFDADMLAYVKNGITTIRFAGLDQGEVVNLRERVEQGALIGPRILSCGPMIDLPPVAYPEWTVPVETAARGGGNGGATDRRRRCRVPHPDSTSHRAGDAGCR